MHTVNQYRPTLVIFISYLCNREECTTLPARWPVAPVIASRDVTAHHAQMRCFLLFGTCENSQFQQQIPGVPADTSHRLQCSALPLHLQVDTATDRRSKRLSHPLLLQVLHPKPAFSSCDKHSSVHARFMMFTLEKAL